MKYLVAITVAILVSICLIMSAALALPPEGEPLEQSSRLIDNTTYINANQILMFVTNHGNFGRDLSGMFGYDYGTFYPYTTVEDIEMGTNTTSPQYAAGIWLGGLVYGEVRVAIAEFSDEFVPGPMAGGGHLPDHPSHKVYKLYSDSLEGNPNDDYTNWPAWQGAPVDAAGQPLMMGDQMTWAIFNDADPAQHTNNSGDTEPLGIEVRQTFWADAGSGGSSGEGQEITILQCGDSRIEVKAYVDNIGQITGHEYAVILNPWEPIWKVMDLSTNDDVIEWQDDYSGDSLFRTDHGFSVWVNDSDGSFQSFEVVANASGPLDPPEPGAARWAGFPVPDGPDGDGLPTDNQQIGGGRWLLHTVDNGGSSGGGERGSYEMFSARVLRNDNIFQVGQSDWEMRFTGSNDNPGVEGGYAVELYLDYNVIWVPFELWATGNNTPDDPSDDVRLFPVIVDAAGPHDTWEGDDMYALESWGLEPTGGGELEHSVSEGDDDPYTDWVYWRMPNDGSPGESGYYAVEAQMLAGTYDGGGEEIMARTVLVNLDAGDQPPFTQACPEQGTVFRITTSDPMVADTFRFRPSSSDLLAADNVIYMSAQLRNRGNETIEDFYVSLWVDPDLGGYDDDLVGCDSAASLGFVYNADNDDTQYGSAPPCLAYDLLQGPLVETGNPADMGRMWGNSYSGYTNLPMTAFSKYINGTDPDNATESYRYMQGLNKNGSPYINPSTGFATTFMHSGDPVAGAGDRDYNPADRRFLMTTGPFTFAPGDSTEVIAALVIGQGPDRLSSIARMELDDQLVQAYYAALYDYYPPQPALIAPMQPDTLYHFWTQAIEPIVCTVTVGWSDVHMALKEIAPGSIQISDIATFESVTVVGAEPGFSGEAIRIEFLVKDFIQAQGLTFDYKPIRYFVTGNYVDGEPFGALASVILGGHISGDVTGDGSCDIADIVFLVEYMFQQGPPPPIMRQADVNASGGLIDIADLIYLVDYMFQGGPSPHCQ